MPGTQDTHPFGYTQLTKSLDNVNGCTRTKRMPESSEELRSEEATFI